MDTTTEYVLCYWNGCWWPAKVLSRPGTSAKSKRKRALSLQVQILVVDEKAKVRSTDTKALTEPEIEALASSLAGARPEVTDPPAQEASYRRALSLAREILREKTLLHLGTAPGKPGTTVLSPKAPHKPASSHPLRKDRKSHREYPWENPKKRQHPKSQLVPPEGKDDQKNDKAQVLVATTALPAATVPAKVAQGASVPPSFLSPLGGKGGGKKEGKTLVSMGRAVSSTAPHGVGDPGEGTSRPSREGTAGSSMGPSQSWRRSLWIADRKRKLQGPDGNKGPDPQTHSHSKATDAMAVSEGAGGKRRKGQGATKVPFARKPVAIKQGMMVWFKFQDHPFWPAVVKSMNKTQQTARVLLIEANLCRERSGIRVPLHRLKPLECEEKEKLLRRASKAYQQATEWCFTLIAHYQEGLSCRTFTGSFLDYYVADTSYPVRKAIQEGDLEVPFPKVNYADLEDSEEEAAGAGKWPHRKLLPDRMRAAQDRANQKLVDFIVKRKGADRHLLDIMQGRKSSTWLTSFLKSSRYMLCIETYLEDDDQLDAVVKHLQEIYEQMGHTLLTLIRGDKVRFLLEVLLPEALICSIAALDELDYKEAEEKYLRGPPVRYREKDLFDKKILKERRKRSATSSRLGRLGASFLP